MAEFEKEIERIIKMVLEHKFYNGMTLNEAFEKQIPKAPVGGYCELWRCPVCGCLDIVSYCANCGQKIDWEAVDDE